VIYSSTDGSPTRCALAALGEQARARVKAGCLTRELHHAGVGDAASDTLSAGRCTLGASGRSPG
jgi:hypothetical protein